MPGTEVTQHARERTRVIVSQDPARCSRQEKRRGWGGCSVIISLDKSTSRQQRAFQITAVTLPCQHETWGCQVSWGQHWTCAAFPEGREKVSGITAVWPSVQTRVRQWKIGGYKKSCAWGWKEEKKADLLTQPSNSFILFIRVWAARMCTGGTLYKQYVQNLGCLYLENAGLWAVR